jgi:hypothetical protein
VLHLHPLLDSFARDNNNVVEGVPGERWDDDADRSPALHECAGHGEGRNHVLVLVAGCELAVQLSGARIARHANARWRRLISGAGLRFGAALGRQRRLFAICPKSALSRAQHHPPILVVESYRAKEDALDTGDDAAVARHVRRTCADEAPPLCS